MSKRSRESMREFQARLTERIQAVQIQTGPGSKLGFIAGGRQWLVNLDQINEVVTVPALAGIPWTKPWFAGVANVRGVVYGCTDLAAFLDLSAPLPVGESRLLLVNPEFGVNAGWRVERALGLRSIERLTREPDNDNAPPWEKGRWRDADRSEWVEIDFSYLVALPKFLEAGL